MSVTEITIPAAGESKNILVVGRAIYVEAVGSYSSPKQVPQIFADTTNSEGFPLYPPPTRKTFDKKFSRLVVVGTEESAGDVAYIRATDDCIGTELSPLTAESRRAVCGATFTKAASDSVQDFETLELENDGVLPSKIYVSALNNDIRYAFRSDPEQSTGDVGHVLTAGDDPVEINGIDFILNFKFINSVNASNGVLVITAEY